MAKQGQHNDDARDSDVSRGNNNPDKSVTITAGTPKKKDTYDAQARAHDDPGKPAQAAKNSRQEPARDPDDAPLRARDSDITGGRSGSDSNASRRTRG